MDCMNKSDQLKHYIHIGSVTVTRLFYIEHSVECFKLGYFESRNTYWIKTRGRALTMRQACDFL